MKKLTTAMIALLLSCSIIFSGCEDTSSSKSKKHKKKDKKEKIEEVEPEEETDETKEPEESDEPDETEESEVIEETEASADYEVLYAPIIEEYISLMDDFDSETYWDTVDYKDGYSWLPESCFYSGADYVSENYGFAYVDLNDDEIMELLIVESLINDYDNEGSYVNAIFTLYEGEPAFVMEGYYRSAYYLSGDNKLAYFGSGGWAYTSFGQFSYDEDFDMIWDNYYFSDLDSDGETVIYYAQTDNNDDMRYEIDEDTFEQEYDNLAYNTTSIEFTSFAQYAEDNNIELITYYDLVKIKEERNK